MRLAHWFVLGFDLLLCFLWWWLARYDVRYTAEAGFQHGTIAKWKEAEDRSRGKETPPPAA